MCIRDSSVAGRLFVRRDGSLDEKLVNIDRDLLVIPSVAIHMNRNANDGMKYMANIDTIPLFSSEDPAAAILPMAAEAAGVSPDNVLGSDLFLYCRGRGVTFGAHNEYILSPRLDDLALSLIHISLLGQPLSARLTWSYSVVRPPHPSGCQSLFSTVRRANNASTRTQACSSR